MRSYEYERAEFFMGGSKGGVCNGKFSFTPIDCLSRREDEKEPYFLT